MVTALRAFLSSVSCLSTLLFILFHSGRVKTVLSLWKTVHSTHKPCVCTDVCVRRAAWVGDWEFLFLNYVLAGVNWFMESHTVLGIKTLGWDSENMGLTTWSPPLKHRETRASAKQPCAGDVTANSRSAVNLAQRMTSQSADSSAAERSGFVLTIWQPTARSPAAPAPKPNSPKGFPEFIKSTGPKGSCSYLCKRHSWKKQI